MKRFLLFVVACWSIAPAEGIAQDMPLHQILSEGKNWERIAPDRVNLPPRSATVAQKGEPPPATSDYFTVPQRGEVWFRPRQGELTKRTVPLRQPGGSLYRRNRQQLWIHDRAGKHIWIFHTDEEGNLRGAERYYPLHVRRDAARIDVYALALDTAGRLYALTPENIQIFDPTGRLSGLLWLPRPADATTEMGFDPKRPQRLQLRYSPQEAYERELLAEGASDDA